VKHRSAAAAMFLVGGVYVLRMAVAAQGVSTAVPGGAGGQDRPVSTAVPGGAGGQDRRLVAYPPRAKAPQEVLDRGKAVYGVNCGFCHGSDAGGGEIGPNLWRSGVVLEDQSGELIKPIVHGARADKGMPAIPINDAQIEDVAAWLHSLKVVSRTDPEEEKINIVTGDPKAGEVYFQKTCASCHSVTGDLKGIATRIPDPKPLQQTWLLPGGAGGRGPAGPAAKATGLHIPPTTVSVTMTDGQTVDGTLSRLDDFYVGLVANDGSVRGFARDGDTPKIVLHDPLKPHRDLLRTYADKDIHDLTAYLVTLK